MSAKIQRTELQAQLSDRKTEQDGHTAYRSVAFFGDETPPLLMSDMAATKFAYILLL
jgi:hypothetical protein